MSKMTLLDKWKIFFDVSKSSIWFIIAILLLIVIGVIFATTNKRNAKKNKQIYIIFSLFTFFLLIVIYHGSLANIFDYMMDNFFIAIYFPNLAIYLVAIIIMNIILWISLFHFKTAEIIKRINIIVYVLMNYLLALILGVVNNDRLDVFSQSSIYNNKKATALIELSSLLFMIWIIFLILYKIILVYIRKDYKPKVKKVIVRKPVKILPENFEPVEIPKYIYGSIHNKESNKKLEVKNWQMSSPSKATVKTGKPATADFEKLLTRDDYKLLLRMLKEQKEKDKIAKQQQEMQEKLLRERIRQEEKEQEKFTELEMLYRSIR